MSAVGMGGIFKKGTPDEIARTAKWVRADLVAASPERTVTQIANDWGYVNLGALAGIYRARFGELPSHTRDAARRRH